MSASLLNAISPPVTPSAGAGGETTSQLASAPTDTEFSHSFLTQIQVLQKSGEIPKDIRESKDFQKMAQLIDSEGQSVSALLGEKLPRIKAVKDINLDKTMAALKDILGQLEGLSDKRTFTLPKLSRMNNSERQKNDEDKEESSALLSAVSQTEAVTEELPINTDPDTSAILMEKNLNIEPKIATDLSATSANTTDMAQNQHEEKIDTAALPISTDRNIPDPLVTATINKIDAMDKPEKVDTLNSVTDKVNTIQESLAAVNVTALPVIEQGQQAEHVITPVLRQKNSWVEDKQQSTVISSLVAMTHEDSLKPEVNLAHLLKRENLFSTAQIETSEFKKDALIPKILDTQISNTNPSNDSASQKFASIDLSALNRQIDSAVTKVDIPPMTKPFNHPEWKQEFNERIVWMHNKSISSAELRLNPNNLGPISIAIKMDQDQQTSIQIQAHHAGVRDAIESSIPRLREMLNTQQINLSDVNVSQQQQQGQGSSARQAMQDALNERSASASQNYGVEEGDHASAISDEINQGRIISSKGLLSLYA